MTVLGIGTLELILILLLLILIFGPDRINEMGRWLGQAYRRLTGLTSEVNQQVMEVRRAIDTTVDTAGLTGSIREAAAEVSALKHDVDQAAAEVNAVQRDVNKALADSRAAVKTLQTDVEKAAKEIESGIEGDGQQIAEEPESGPAEPVAVDDQDGQRETGE
jgi:Sec-independent protein translocase protein TatA